MNASDGHAFDSEIFSPKTLVELEKDFADVDQIQPGWRSAKLRDQVVEKLQPFLESDTSFLWASFRPVSGQSPNSVGGTGNEILVTMTNYPDEETEVTPTVRLLQREACPGPNPMGFRRGYIMRDVTIYSRGKANFHTGFFGLPNNGKAARQQDVRLLDHPTDKLGDVNLIRPSSTMFFAGKAGLRFLGVNPTKTPYVTVNSPGATKDDVDWLYPHTIPGDVTDETFALNEAETMIKSIADINPKYYGYSVIKSKI